MKSPNVGNPVQDALEAKIEIHLSAHWQTHSWNICRLRI